MQQGRLHTKRQPLDQLDEVIEGIGKLGIRSTEAVSKGKLSRGEPAIAIGKQKQKQQRSDGVGEQLERTVWDLGGFR